MEEKINPKDIFGVRGIFLRYAKELKYDFWFPAVFALVLLVVAKYFSVNSSLFMAECLSVGMLVVPVLLSVLVAGYVLLLTVYFSGKIEMFKNSEQGRDLLYQISSNYAFCIVNAIIALVITVFFSFVFHLNIQVSHPGYVNYPCTFIVYFFMFFTLKNLKDLAVALFDFGQSFVFEEQLKPQKKDEKLDDGFVKGIRMRVRRLFSCRIL